MSTSMMEYGTINQDDLDLITIVDDLDEMIEIVDNSLKDQLKAIEEMGLSDSNYGEMLRETQKIRG